MALTRALFQRLKEYLKPGYVVSFGYPDIIAPDSDLEAVIGSRIYSIKRREDSESICSRHHIKDRKIVDARAFFDVRGMALDVLDVVRGRGEEKLCDLNASVVRVDGVILHENPFYDVALDIGTLEHCFNIGQALINMAGLVKVGGVILHENPFNWGNHGFYNLNPTLFADFYRKNGFEIVSCDLVDRDGKGEKADLTGRFALTGGEANVLTVARRIEDKAFEFPVQTKYKNSVRAD